MKTKFTPGPIKVRCGEYMGTYHLVTDKITEEQDAANAVLFEAAPEMFAALECSLALDYQPYVAAVLILEKHGWSHGDGLGYSAREFARDLTEKAIKKATA